MTSSERAAPQQTTPTDFVGRNEFVHLLLGLERAGHALDLWLRAQHVRAPVVARVDDVTYALLGLVSLRRTMARSAPRPETRRAEDTRNESSPAFHRGLLR